MPRYRATVYHQSSVSQDIEGDEGIRRSIYEEEAESESQFKAIVRDYWLHDVDADVSFGPVTEKDK